ncbi:MAG: HPr kinase/phosphatase C-terminal domain-containing protein [Rhizobiaceae bacterium]
MNSTQTLHGCAIILGTHGVFIRGQSGSGKSRLAHQLISSWQDNNQFARWVVDDRVQITPYPAGLIARAPNQIKGIAEIRYFGIEPVLYEDTTQLDLIVDLVPVKTLERMPEAHSVKLIGGGLSLPTLNAPDNDVLLAFELVQAFFDKNSLQL